MTDPAQPTTSEVPQAPKAKAKLKVSVLRCRDAACGALMPFEETDQGYLLGRVLELADVDGEVRYLPCPKCEGRLLLEEYEHAGKIRVRIRDFEPGNSPGTA